MADLSAEADVPPTPEAPSAPGLEWLLLRRALAQAEARRGSFPAAAVASMDRARRALEAAERLLFGLEPLRAGDASELALELLAQSATWALAAAAGGAPAGDGEALAAAAKGPGVDEFLATARETGLFAPLLAQGFRDRAAHASSARRDAERAQPLVRRLVDQLDVVLDAPGRVRARRRRRWVALAVVAVAVLALAGWRLRTALAPVDLAAGKRWTSSSAFSGYSTSGSMGRSARANLFFHTSSEPTPWVQIDLQGPTQVGSLEVINRPDCCQARALPLVVELSTDGSQWTEVARQTESFGSWHPRFEPRTARFVRLRGENTMLHLNHVAIFAR